LGRNYLVSKHKGNRAMDTATKPSVPKTNFVPHREDPLLSASEAGRLIGRTHTTIFRWIKDGLLEAVRDEKGLNRIRKSALIKFTGVTAFGRKSPYIWVQEAELPEDYQYLEEYPKIRKMDSITYYPVPFEVETNG
jgi:hypothetical protein